MSVSQIPLKIDELQEDVYGDFGSRLAAILIDLVFLAPLGLLSYLMNPLDKNFQIAFIIFNFFIICWYQIYLVKKYGGTPGKLLAGLKIICINGTKAGWKEAILRHSVGLALSLAFNIVLINAMARADNSHYASLAWTKKNLYLTTFFPLFFNIEKWLNNIWSWSELVVLLTNKKKRALHDFIAGTIVVKIKYMGNIDEIVTHSEEKKEY
jgi:uncharacterized RDD family membrane protein YckC